MTYIILGLITLVLLLEILADWKWLHERRQRSKAFRRQLLNQYGDRCMICRARPVEAHHIVEYAKGGKDDSKNGILLCNKHHQAAHRGEISRKELHEYKKKFDRRRRWMSPGRSSFPMRTSSRCR